MLEVLGTTDLMTFAHRHFKLSTKIDCQSQAPSRTTDLATPPNTLSSHQPIAHKLSSLPRQFGVICQEKMVPGYYRGLEHVQARELLSPQPSKVQAHAAMIKAPGRSLTIPEPCRCSGRFFGCGTTPPQNPLTDIGTDSS
jgi:hypothetical protein